MTIFIRRRHPPAEADFRAEGQRILKGVFESDDTKLRWPESFLFCYYFAHRLKELKTEESTDLVLVYPEEVVRAREDAIGTSVALEMLGIPHEMKRAEYLGERDLGALANQEYATIAQACGSEGIIHALFYSQDFRKIMEECQIPGEDYGEPFDEFIKTTVKGLISLWKTYKKPNDIVVLHTHSLRGVAITNILHYIASRSRRGHGDKLVETIFDSTGPVDEDLLNKAARFKSETYWWQEIGCGEYTIFETNREGSIINVREIQPPSIGVYVKNKVVERPIITDTIDPLKKCTDAEIEYLNRVRDLLIDQKTQ